MKVTDYQPGVMCYSFNPGLSGSSCHYQKTYYSLSPQPYTTGTGRRHVFRAIFYIPATNAIAEFSILRMIACESQASVDRLNLDLIDQRYQKFLDSKT